MEMLQRLAQALFLLALIVLVPGGCLLALSMLMCRRNKQAAGLVPAPIRDGVTFGKARSKR